MRGGVYGWKSVSSALYLYTASNGSTTELKLQFGKIGIWDILIRRACRMIWFEATLICEVNRSGGLNRSH